MNIVCIGAHPDDPEVFAGGMMTLFARAGHNVTAVSLTNGDVGHHEMGGGALAQRRADESRSAARIGGYESVTLDNHDGELVADIALRKAVTHIIRRCKADMVFTHRPNDYHPDHRYAALVVQDAAYMVTVPHFCPDAEALRRNPVFLYFFDTFTFPAPFHADVVVPVDTVMDVKWRLLDAMASQFYEWLPWLDGVIDSVPPAHDNAARIAWLQEYFRRPLEMPVSRCRAALPAWLGDSADNVQYVEAFQVCEYGAQPDQEELRRLFTFSPHATGA